MLPPSWQSYMVSTCFVHTSKIKLFSFFFLAQLAAVTHELKVAQAAGAAQRRTGGCLPRIRRPANLGNLQEAMCIPGSNPDEKYQEFLIHFFFLVKCTITESCPL